MPIAFHLLFLLICLMPYIETTTFDTTTTEDTPSSTESSELNCTVVIPVCSAFPPLTTLDPDLYPSTTESSESTTMDRTEDLDNGTEWGENATSRTPCGGVSLSDDAPCPERCLSKEKVYRRPTQDDLVAIPEPMKDLLRKKCWETAFGQVSFQFSF